MSTIQDPLGRDLKIADDAVIEIGEPIESEKLDAETADFVEEMIAFSESDPDLRLHTHFDQAAKNELAKAFRGVMLKRFYISEMDPR